MTVLPAACPCPPRTTDHSCRFSLDLTPSIAVLLPPAPTRKRHSLFQILLATVATGRPLVTRISRACPPVSIGRFPYGSETRGTGCALNSQTFTMGLYLLGS